MRQRVWVMGYQEGMGYEPRSPAYQLGNLKNVWGTGEYGLSELWVKRALTVVPQRVARDPDLVHRSRPTLLPLCLAIARLESR